MNQFSNRLAWVVPAACLFVVFGGCGGGSPTLVDVGGRITDGGKAVSGASINYQPIAKSENDVYPGPASFGITDSEGRYTLRTFNTDLPGAVPGRHKIYISLPQPESTAEFAAPKGMKSVPSKYCDGSTEIEVSEAGESAIDFDIGQRPQQH